jgi:energy-coupling factor transport system substrate-specific component
MADSARAGRQRGRLASWSTRDLLVVAAIGVALGVALIPVTYLGLALMAALGPFLYVLAASLSRVPSVMAMYVVRRPGAAVLGALVAGLVQVPFTPTGWVILVAFAFSGLGCELPFLLTRYRRFGLPMLMAAGAVAALLGLALQYVPFGYANLALPVQLALILTAAAGGAAITGGLAKLLADALARTGVLSGYAVGQQRQEV